MSCISLPRLSGLCNKMARVTRNRLYGNTPDFLLNSSFYAPDNGDDMEVGVKILVSICIHYNFSVSSSFSDGSYFFTQYTPHFSLLQHKTNHTHRVNDTTNSNIVLSPFLWEHLTGWNVQPADLVASGWGFPIKTKSRSNPGSYLLPW